MVSFHPCRSSGAWLRVRDPPSCLRAYLPRVRRVKFSACALQMDTRPGSGCAYVPALCDNFDAVAPPLWLLTQRSTAPPNPSSPRALPSTLPRLSPAQPENIERQRRRRRGDGSLLSLRRRQARCRCRPTGFGSGFEFLTDRRQRRGRGTGTRRRWGWGGVGAGPCRAQDPPGEAAAALHGPPARTGESGGRGEDHARRG